MVSSCRNNGTISQELRYPFTGTVVQFWQESSGKGAKLTLSKTSGAPRTWTATSWGGKTIMKKSYKYGKNKSVHKMVVKKADIKYGKK